MGRNLFSRLKKYSGGLVSQDENYVTEALATLLDEFPSFRNLLVRELFNIEMGSDVAIATQVSFETKRFGKAALDLVIEDQSNFVIVELKVESGLNYYESKKDVDQVTYDQIAKYEDCEGLPDERISIFTLSKYPLHLAASGYKYFKPDSNQIRWHTLYTVTDGYNHSLSAPTAERYLLGKFIEYLKGEGMAAFQGFKIDHIVNLSRQGEVDAVCSDFRALILQNISVLGFKGKEQTRYGRDGILYTPEQKLRYVAIFAGLWLSDEIYYFKFLKETGPQAMVFVETDPKGQLAKDLLSSQALARVSERFGRQSMGWQIVLCHKPLVEFVGSKDQAHSLLEFYGGAIDDLRVSGLLDEITSWNGNDGGVP